MRVIEINGKEYTDRQIESAIRKQVQGNTQPLMKIMDEIPPEGIDPGYKELILSVQNDPVANMIAKRELERGIKGFGAITPLLSMAEILIDVYSYFCSRRKK